MTDYTFDGVAVFLIAVAIVFFESLFTLASIFYKGIYKNQKQILMEKTNKELRLILRGVKGISNLNKNQLVEKVLAL
tara:strand:+ start:125 stop:355 length:231 start_codon:yes stop_codon:yes gene_type:complete